MVTRADDWWNRVANLRFIPPGQANNSVSLTGIIRKVTGSQYTDEQLAQRGVQPDGSLENNVPIKGYEAYVVGIAEANIPPRTGIRYEQMPSGLVTLAAFWYVRRKMPDINESFKDDSRLEKFREELATAQHYETIRRAMQVTVLSQLIPGTPYTESVDMTIDIYKLEKPADDLLSAIREFD